MSSLLRRIARTVVPSQKVHPVLDRRGEPVCPPQFYANPPRKKAFGGRGSRLGVTNPKGAELLARRKRDKKWGRKS